jgi:hypothetical protein
MCQAGSEPLPLAHEAAHVALRAGPPPPRQAAVPGLRAALSVPTELVRFYGWQPWQLWSTIEWCGHRVEGIPVPTEDGRYRLIPILGEAR